MKTTETMQKAIANSKEISEQITALIAKLAKLDAKAEGGASDE